MTKVMQVLKSFAKLAETRDEVLKYAQMAITEAWKTIRTKIK